MSMLTIKLKDGTTKFYKDAESMKMHDHLWMLEVKVRGGRVTDYYNTSEIVQIRNES